MMLPRILLDLHTFRMLSRARGWYVVALSTLVAGLSRICGSGVSSIEPWYHVAGTRHTTHQLWVQHPIHTLQIPSPLQLLLPPKLQTRPVIQQSALMFLTLSTLPRLRMSLNRIRPPSLTNKWTLTKSWPVLGSLRY
jgi:hypothetical protein